MLIFFYLPFLKYICCWKKSSDLVLLYKIGKRKIDNELNVKKLIKNLNIMKIFMKNNILTENVRWKVAHCEKNVIDLEDNYCSSDDFSSEE